MHSHIHSGQEPEPVNVYIQLDSAISFAMAANRD